MKTQHLQKSDLCSALQSNNYNFWLLDSLINQINQGITDYTMTYNSLIKFRNILELCTEWADKFYLVFASIILLIDLVSVPDVSYCIGTACCALYSDLCMIKTYQEQKTHHVHSFWSWRGCVLLRMRISNIFMCSRYILYSLQQSWKNILNNLKYF